MTSLLIFNTHITSRSPFTFKPPPLIIRTPPVTRVSISNDLVRRKMKDSTLVTRVSVHSDLVRRKMRVSTAVTRAIPSSSYVYAFVFPFSLLAVTIFTSIKIADKLDRDFLEDLEVNEAIRLGEDMEETNDSISVKEESKTAISRTRSRPKRQA